MVRISDTGQAELNSYMATNGPVLPQKGPAPSNAASIPRTTGNTYAPDFDIDPYASGLGGGLPTFTSMGNFLPQSWQPYQGPAQNLWDEVSSFSAPPRPFSLDFESQGYQSPIVAPPPTFQQPFVNDPWGEGGGSFLGGIGGALGGALGDFGRGALDFGQQVWDIQQQRTNVSGGIGYAPYGSGGSAQVDPKQQSLEALEYQVSGNKWLEAAGLNPDALPYGLGYVTDAINPIGIAAVGAGPSVPIIGSTLGGGLAKRAAGEVAIDIASRVGAEQAAGDFGESIPYFGELPPVARGLIGGLAGGIGAAGGIKAIDDVDFGAAGRSLAESNPFAAPQPGTFDLPRGAIDPTTGRPFEWQAPMGGADEAYKVGDFVRGRRGEEWVVTGYSPDGYVQVKPLDGSPGTPLMSELAESYLTPLGGANDLYGRFRALDPLSMVDERLELPEAWIKSVDPRAAKSNAKNASGDWVEVVWDGGTIKGNGADKPLIRIRSDISEERFNEVLEHELIHVRQRFGISDLDAEVEAYGAKGLPPSEAARLGDSSPLSPDAPQVMDARRSLLDALDEEIRFRESGEAETLIRQGRAQQAQGIMGSIGETRGGTFDEALQGARAGASVGSMLPDGRVLPEGIKDALTKELQDYALQTGKSFDYLRAMKALDKLGDGQRLQPGEIKLLGQVFGSEVEQAIRRTNAGRIAIRAELTDADLAEINRLAVVDGRRVAKLEVEARAQHQLADDLARRLRMNPTNKALQKATEAAQARALKLDADFDRALRESIERANLRAADKQARDIARSQQAQVRAEVREQEALDKWQAGIEARLAKDAETRAYVESGEKALDQAIKAIEKSELPDSVKATAREAVNEMVKIDRVVLDSMAGDAPGFLRVVYAGATGELTDSWVSTLYEQTAFLRGALEDIGFDSKTAGSIADSVRDMEIARRWGPNPPKHVLDSVEQAKRMKGGPRGADNVVRGAAMISQEFKNLMFGIADIGIAGIQGLVSVQQGFIPMLAGLANRTLNVARLGVDTSPGALSRRVMYGLDGRVRSGATYTGATDASGTMLRHIPGLKTLDEKVIARAIGKMNDIQFRGIMGFLGDLVHEGQLAMLAKTGADITDPAVRRSSAEFANAISSAGKLAQRAGRADFERAAALSPSMIRAQSQVLGKIGRLLLPGTAREDRILAASIIVSYGVTLAAIGKVLNDYVGTEDFEFDPSKPNAWRIRLPSGHIITPFPQTQLFRLLTRAGRVLAEEGDGEQDPAMIQRAFLNFGLGRMSPATGIGAAAVGVGFDPESGWRYGDLGEGKSWWEKVLSNLLPIPPVIESVATEGLDPVGTPLEVLGLSNFRESDYSARDRAIASDPRFNGRTWAQLEEHEKVLWNSEQGRLYHSDPTIKAQQERADVIAGDALAYQEKIDGWLRAGQKPDGTPYTVDDWKLDRAKADRYTAGRYDELYRDVDWKDKNLTPVDRYYQAIADRVNPETDEVDWDRVENWLKGQSWEDQAYIARNTNLRDTEMEKDYRTDVKKIADSGYFDLEEGKMQFRQENPEIAELVRKWGYSKLSVAAEDQINQYRTQQEMDDQALESGTMDPEKWRENRKTRQAQLSAAKDAIFAALTEDGESTEALDQYFATIEANKPNGIDVDWDAVDAWVAQQPPEVQQTIDSYAGTALTPKVQEYRDAVAKIEASQYWDINDRVAQRVVEAQGGTWTEGMTADRYYGQIEAAVYQRLQERGFSALEAQSLTGVVMQDVMRPYLDIAGKVRGAMREADPELMRLLIAWGYYTPGKETTAELLASGGLR